MQVCPQPQSDFQRQMEWCQSCFIKKLLKAYRHKIGHSTTLDFHICSSKFCAPYYIKNWIWLGKMFQKQLRHRISISWRVDLNHDQGRNEVRWRPVQETRLAPPFSNLRSFGRKYTVLQTVLMTLPRLFEPRVVIRRPHSDSAPGELCLSYHHVTLWLLWLDMKKKRI